MSTSLLLLIYTSFSCHSLNAQNQTNIADAIKADSLFWFAYNNCDVNGMMRFIPHDIEFFHDKGGITLGDSAFEASIKSGLCADSSKFKLRRERVPGSSAANPMMKNGQLYGVLMTGKHIFYLSQNGAKEFADGIAQYADLWLLREGQWKMARVFSFDHQPVAKQTAKAKVSVPAAILKSYAGKYDGGKAGPLTIQHQKGYLTVISSGQRLDVYPSSSTLFHAQARDLSFEFANKGAGITQVIVREDGEIVDRYSSGRR